MNHCENFLAQTSSHIHNIVHIKRMIRNTGNFVITINNIAIRELNTTRFCRCEIKLIQECLFASECSVHHFECISRVALKFVVYKHFDWWHCINQCC